MYKYAKKCKIPNNARYHMVPNTRQYDMPVRVISQAVRYANNKYNIISDASVQGTVISIVINISVMAS